jgi:hypothetical protein
MLRRWTARTLSALMPLAAAILGSVALVFLVFAVVGLLDS